jgi:hypothetical protein
MGTIQPANAELKTAGQRRTEGPPVNTTILWRRKPLSKWPVKLGYVRSKLLPILALNRLHLVFQAQFKLLEPDFFQLFVFA